MRAEIKVPHKKLKTTIVYVTQDQIEAMTMADKIVGTPLDLYRNPANSMVSPDDADTAIARMTAGDVLLLQMESLSKIHSV